MKKNGFTLAEVLITLSIIGVVATLTLPSLMTNTGEQQMVTAYKKIINSLSEAGQMNSALDGFDYTSAVTKGAAGDLAETTSTLMALFNSRLQISSTNLNSTIPGCTSPLLFRDGTAFCTGNITRDANMQYYTMLVDVNGKKGPNQLSNCNEAGCTNKAKKHIYDQFYVTLYGGAAIPGKWSSVGTPETNATQYAADYASGVIK